jgi:hypothetical protein
VSPTYWTASQIKIAARANSWEFIKAETPAAPWGCRKPGRKVMLQEDRRGGLTQVWLTYDGINVHYFGPRYRGKLLLVLRFLEGLDHTGVAAFAASLNLSVH